MKIVLCALTALVCMSAAGSEGFDAVSVKAAKSGIRGYSIRPYPNRLSCANVTLKQLIAAAYRVYDFQVTGGPKWVDDQRYDIEAKAASNISEKELMTMMQPLLAERFHLNLRHESKVSSVFVLEPGKGGPKVKQTEDAATPVQFRVFQRRQITSSNAPLMYLTEAFSHLLGRPVLDKTGLSGNFDYKLEWTPDEVQVRSDESAPAGDTSSPSLFSALEEQLGLRLREQKQPVEILIVDRAEKATEN